jgi:hypothetical protein
MNLRRLGTRSFLVVAGIACVYLVVAASRPDEELTATKPYADLVGTDYVVITDDLYAYGIRRNYGDTVISWVKLIPGVGIGGPEVAFRRHIPKGQIIQILSAWRQPLLFDNGVYYRVAVRNSDLPSDVPTAVELFRGNEGEGAELNPSIYRKLVRTK